MKVLSTIVAIVLSVLLCQPGDAGIQMVLIPAGSFTMGNCMDPNEGNVDELPLHSAYVSAYYMDVSHVTKSQWTAVYCWATNHGYSFSVGSGKADDHPVLSVNWYDCVKWCNARSQKEGLTPCYYICNTLTLENLYTNGTTDIQNSWVNWSADGYRLPTEAEWEKAARGGVPSHRFPWIDTDNVDHAYANYSGGYSYLYPYDYGYDGFDTRFAIGDYPFTSPVGSFPANGYGLHDMAGNALQWCWDWYGSYTSSPVTDYRGPTNGTGKVMRGGDWYDWGGGRAINVRCAERVEMGPSDRGNAIPTFGFRCVRGSFDNLKTGLVAYYPFNGNANDESGRGHHGIPIGVISTTNRFGIPDSALNFNGTDSFITIPDHDDLDLTTQFTLSAWIYQQDSIYYGYRIIDKCTAGVSDGYTFDTRADGTGRGLRLTNGQGGKEIRIDKERPLNEWQFVVATMACGYGRLYLNGQLVSEDYVGIYQTNTLSLFIGRSHPPGQFEWFKAKPLPHCKTLCLLSIYDPANLRGLAMKVVAADIGVDESTYCLWESGKRFPNAENLDAIALYACLPVCLFFRNGDAACEKPQSL